ncbi:Endoribonuclease L-PSP [Actinacidiphila glaucinigra]|uniref:Endoribonuclease L-PSP n=1 Tax=Actinacidiphila glaucinigra TaxID=235986 RepID=A0A238ZDR8_9ACTN|nr:Endoribonuclease L-PSP [Actinacidiphila glaucinigra]
MSHDSADALIGSGDFEPRMRTTLGNLDRVLEHFGARRDQIVETTVLVRGLRDHFGTVARLHAAYCGDVEIGAAVRLDVDH